MTVPDMWENFEKYKELYDYVWQKTKERTGTDTKSVKIEKCRFAGTNAIKLIVRQSSDDVYNQIEEQGLKVFFRGGCYEC